MALILLHSALYIEVVLNDESTAAEEVVFSVKLAEHNSVCNFFADETYHLSLAVVELLFVEVEIVENYLLCKVADSQIVDEDGVLCDDIVHESLYRFIAPHKSHENSVGIDLGLIALCDLIENGSLVL